MIWNITHPSLIPMRLVYTFHGSVQYSFDTARAMRKHSAHGANFPFVKQTRQAYPGPHFHKSEKTVSSRIKGAGSVCKILFTKI
jgi:hypothetical protein